MKLHSSFFALSVSVLLHGASALAQAPAPVQPPPAPVQPAAPSTSPDIAGNRPAQDRAPSSVEGLEPEAGGLTADETARRALAASATVKQKRAQLVAANEKITQTTFQFFPRLTLLASYTRTSPINAGLGGGALVGAARAGGLTVGPCPSGTGQCILDSSGTPIGAQEFAFQFPENNYLLNAHLSIPISDYVLRVADAAAASSSSREAAKIAVEAEKAKVASDARALYFNWLRARAQAAVAKNAVERTRARLQDARATFTAGQISKADLLRLEAQVANTELVATRANSLVSLTTGQLAIIMEDWNPAYRVGQGIPVPADVPETHTDVTTLVREAQTNRLEVHAIDETTKALNKGASATRASALPRIDAIGDYTYANPNQRYFPLQQVWHGSWSAGVQATWTLGDAFLNSAAARELEANAKATQAQRTALRAGIANEVLTAYLDVTRAQAAFEQQKVALAAAEEGYRVTTDLFKAGRATSTDLVLSEGELLDAKLGDVNARIDLTIATIALRHATARDLATTPKTAAN
jgi:outer membrane protein TolC